MLGGVSRSLSAVRIFVDDLARSRRFYGEMLELPERAAAPGHAVFGLGEVSIVVEALARDDPERGGLVGRFLAVSFACADDIETTYRRLLARGVGFMQPPEKQEWGGTLAFLRDPDGNVLTLVG